MAFTYNKTTKEAKEAEAAKKRQQQDEQALRDFQLYTPGTYEQRADLKDMYNTITNWQLPTWDKTNNEWWNKLTNTTNALENREKFSYDVTGDALYQQYKDQYMTQGNMAMMDTIGQASAMTGGYGNSYAQSVGQQTYQGYMQQLTDKIPELWQMAYNKYTQEGQEMKDLISMYGSLYNTEYGEHRDAVTDSKDQLSHLTNVYNIESGNDYDQWYGNEQLKSTASQQQYQKLADQLGISTDQAKTLYDMAYKSQYDNYSTGVAESQWQQEFNEAQKSKDLQNQLSDLQAANDELRNQYVVDTGAVRKAKKNILSEDQFKNKYKVTGWEGKDGWDDWGITPKGYSDGKSTYSDYKDYVKKTLAEAYEAGDFNEATLNSLLDYYGID